MRAFPDEQFRVEAQRRVIHNGVSKREDLHVAERVQGGKAIVIDAKHFEKTPLPKHEVRQPFSLFALHKEEEKGDIRKERGDKQTIGHRLIRGRWTQP